MSKYTFIRFVISCNRGLLVGWSRGGGGGRGRVPLGGKVFLGRKVPLNGGIVFWGFRYELKLPFKEYWLVLGFCSWYIILAFVYTGSFVLIIMA